MQVAVSIETATTIEPYLAATIEFWPGKYETLVIETGPQPTDIFGGGKNDVPYCCT